MFLNAQHIYGFIFEDKLLTESHLDNSIIHLLIYVTSPYRKLAAIKAILILLRSYHSLAKGFSVDLLTVILSHITPKI